MSVPEMPWYDALEKLLHPISPYSSWALVIMAIVLLWVAFRGDAVTKMAVLIWIVSP